MKRFSRHASREETVDVETAIRMLITKLQTEKQAAGIDPDSISRAQLDDLMENLTQSEHGTKPRQIPAIPYKETGKPEAEPIAEITLALRSDHKNKEGILLTPNTLIRSVGPYINALIAIQNVFNQLKGLPLRKIAILEIHSQPELRVRLDGASEAVMVVKGIINSWRNRYHNQLHRAATGKLQSSLERKTLDRSKVEMASQMLELVKAGLSEKEKFSHLSALLPLIDILIFSEFEIA